MKRYLILLLFGVKCSFAVSHLYMLHLNGINVLRSEAQKNLTQLEQHTQIKPYMIFNTVYNPTKTPDEWTWVAKVKGALDVWEQKWFESYILPILDEVIIEVMKAQDLNYPIDSAEYKQFKNKMVEMFQDVLLDNGGKNMKTVIDEFHQEIPIQFFSVLKLLSQNIQQDYSKFKDYVILLPHSQGNLYANNLYTYLTTVERFNSSHITTFGFASPAKTELGQMVCNSNVFNYVTSKNDGVIELARRWMPGNVLPSNLTITPTKSDQTGHGLIEVYLNNTGAINMMNNFIFITSNNCFKDLHEVKRIGALPNLGAKIVFDKNINSIVQINQHQICAYNVSGSYEWKCNGINTDQIDATSLSTDNNGLEYFIGQKGNQTFLFEYGFDKGIINTIKLDNGYYAGTPTKYYQGKIYFLNNNTLRSVDIATGITTLKNIFDGIVNNLSIMDINDNKIYIAPMDNKDFRNPAQVYYQDINGGSINLFGKKTDEHMMFDLSIQNNELYLCGMSNLYYAPLGSDNNVAWHKLGYGCKQIISDGVNLYFTTWVGDLIKYN